jgi:ubiquitin-conjugating enzyme E2 O
VIKVFRTAESALEKAKDSNNLSENKKVLNSTSKIHQLSKRLMQLLPFTQTSRIVSSEERIESKISDSENSSKESETNKESTSEDCASTSQTNVSTFLKLIDSLKTEILNSAQNNENESIDSAISEEKSDKDSLNPINTELNEDLNDNLSNEISQTENIEELKNNSILNEAKGKVIFLDSVPDCHKYFASINQPKNAKEFMKRIKQEILLLETALPEGIDVALFHDRMDLLSVLVFGPKGTPYEDGLFLFDIQLPASYPNTPPLVHYISYCSDRLNPNLYESGKVCISLLGTWNGKGTEVWSESTSNILQVIVSIQGLILVAEPYYNEAGYLKQRGTSIANDNSRLYNEMVVIKLIQSMTKLLLTPPKTFETTIREHIVRIGHKFIERHENWASISELCISKSITTIEELNKFKELRNDVNLPQFPLLPASYGFCLTLKKSIALFRDTLLSIN